MCAGRMCSDHHTGEGFVPHVTCSHATFRTRPSLSPVRPYFDVSHAALSLLWNRAYMYHIPLAPSYETTLHVAYAALPSNALCN